MFTRLYRLIMGIALTMLIPYTAYGQTHHLVVGEYFDRDAYEFAPDGTRVGRFAFTQSISRFNGIVFDSVGNLYVAGVQTRNVRRFCPSGSDAGNYLINLSSPSDVAIDAFGDFYVACVGDNSIQRFSSEGVYLGIFALVINPDSMAFDSAGNLFVSSYNTNTVRKIAQNGQTQTVFASVASPTGIAFDSAGDLYVASSSANTIRRYSAAGVDKGVFASTGINDPRGIVFDTAGNLYVANYGRGTGSTVRRFSPKGADLGDFAKGLNAPADLAFRPVTNTKVTLSGAIELQGNETSSEVPVTFEFRAMYGCPSLVRTIVPDKYGNYAIPDIPFGRYEVAVKGSKWLRSTAILDMVQDIAGQHFTLYAGDADGNNHIDSNDLALFIEAFDSDPTSDNWNPLTDFNCDNYVDVFDLDLLIQNFDREGDS